MKKYQTLPISCVKQNVGQIDGLPTNPRQWTQTDIDRIARSLEETPELFDARPLIVYPHGSEYVILGGNLRYEGAKKNGMMQVPVHILPEGLSIDKLKEIVVKDNGSFGAWDMDMLANEWDDLPLVEWGVNVAWEQENAEKASKEKSDLSDDLNVRYCVEITCISEKEQETLYNEMIGRGYECRILTL